MTETQNMIQYSCWSNCCNDCQFCLRRERRPYTKERQLIWLDRIKENVKMMDWKDKFSYGISLLGGELYFIQDKEVQNSFMELIDVIIENVLKVSENPGCRYSSVTNGIYNPTFLYRVIDKIVKEVGIEKVDINFSYDLKHRFSKESDRLLVLKNINEFHKRYDYDVGVQMILTQYVINEWKENRFDVNEFMKNEIPGNHLTFLYPHPIATGIELNDFFFNRKDFLNFMRYLKAECYDIYFSFLQSTKNSCSFKYTGLKDRARNDSLEMPKLTDGKEILNEKCGHSMLYSCYNDSNKCVLCDLMALDGEIYI